MKLHHKVFVYSDTCYAVYSLSQLFLVVCVTCSDIKLKERSTHYMEVYFLPAGMEKPFPRKLDIIGCSMYCGAQGLNTAT